MTVVGSAEHAIPIAILFITDHVDPVPEYVHDVCRRDVANGEFRLVEFDFVPVRIESGPVNHLGILTLAHA